jgi:hypothetical protein
MKTAAAPPEAFFITHHMNLEATVCFNQTTRKEMKKAA